MPEAALTKKQQKAAEWKGGKGKKAKTDSTTEQADDDARAASAEVEAAVEESKAEASSSKATLLASSAEQSEKPEKRNKKRKRLEEEAAAAGVSGVTVASTQGKPKAKQSDKAAKPKASKKAAETSPAKKITFGDDGQVEAETDVQAPTTAAAEDNAAYKDSKYILFVGNMSFDTSKEVISKHFGQACGETPSVRLLTTKADPTALAKLSASKQKSVAKGKAKDPSVARSKGCAFVEFKTQSGLQKALQFHHTTLDGRKINVELTAGGGGKTDARMDKIKKKNEGLEKEREKLHGKYVAPKNEARKAANASKDGAEPNRAAKRAKIFAAKDGQDATKDGQEQGAAQWGRTKDGKSNERKLPRFMATGSNAVRVAPTS